MADILLQTRLDGAQQVQQGFSSIAASVRELQTMSVAVGATIGTVLGGIAYQAAYRLTGTIKESVTELANYGERLEKLRQQTGLSVQTLSQIDFVAKNNSISLESVTTGFRTFARQVEAANNGSKQAIKTMADLGISIKDIRSLNTEELWKKSVDNIGKMSEGTERAAASTRAFSLSARNIQVIAGQLKEGAEAADKLGYTMGERAQRAAMALDDQMDALDRRMEAAKRTMAVEFAPAITLVIDGMNRMFDVMRSGAPSAGDVVTSMVRKMREEFAKEREELLKLAAVWEFVSGLFKKPEGTLGERWKKMNEEIKAAQEGTRRELFSIATTVEDVGWPGQRPQQRGRTDGSDTAAKQAEDEAHKRLVAHLENESRLVAEVKAELKGFDDERLRIWKEDEKAQQAAAAAEAQHVASMEKTKEAMEDAADPMRVFARQLEVIDELQRRYGLSTEAAAKATQKAAEEMERASGKITEKSPWDELLREIQGFGRQFTDRLYEITTGAEDAFGNLLKSIGEMFSKKILHEFITKPFMEVLDELIQEVRKKQEEMGGGGGGIGGLISAAGSALGKSIGGLFGGGGGYYDDWNYSGEFQHGGYIPPGYSGLVGEKGPELITAGRSGATVTPMSQGDTFNFQWHIAAGVSRAELTALVPKIKADTMAAIYDAKRRGGRFS